LGHLLRGIYLKGGAYLGDVNSKIYGISGITFLKLVVCLAKFNRKSDNSCNFFFVVLFATLKNTVSREKQTLASHPEK